MHISDGVLNIETIVAVSVVSSICIIKSLKDTSNEKITLTAAMSAMFFIASFIHIPVGVSQIHLLLIGIIGIMIGWSSIISISIALILQAVLLGYGGIVSLGVNIFIMGAPAIIIYYIYKSRLFEKFGKKVEFFLVGFLGTFFSTLFLALILLFAKKEYEYAAYSILGINTISMIVEGIVSMFLLLFISKTYPSIIKR